MKTYLAILVVGAGAGVLIASSLVLAQTAKPGAAPVAEARQDRLEKVKVEAVPAMARVVRLVELYVRQARPAVRAELIFVRSICMLDVEHFRRVHDHAEAVLQETIEKYVEDRQQGRVPFVGDVSLLLRAEGPSVLQEALTAAMKQDLTPEQFARYQAEVKARDAERTLAAVRYLVALIDRELFLSAAQQQQFTGALVAHWDPNWNANLEYALSGNAFYSFGIDTYIRPFLDPAQSEVWLGNPRMGIIRGIVGDIFGGFVIDNDALEPELGEVKKAGEADSVPNQRGPIPRPAVAKREAAKAVANNRKGKGNPAPAPGLPIALIPPPTVSRIDQLVFGAPRGPAGWRTRLDSLLLVRTADLERTCGITDAQKKKLHLAGRGDIKRFFDKVEELKRTLTEGQNAVDRIVYQELIQQLTALRNELNAGLFGDNSLFSKTIRRTLNHDQAVRFETAVRERAAFGYRATVDWFVIQLDQGLGLTEVQRRQFSELLAGDVRPSRRPGHSDYWYLLSQTSRLPEEKLNPNFDAPQRRHLSRLLARGKAREPFLRANGLIPDDEKPAVPSNRAARVLPAAPAARNAANDATTKSHD